jgi:hypothetical protein
LEVALGLFALVCYGLLYLGLDALAQTLFVDGDALQLAVDMGL